MLKAKKIGIIFALIAITAPLGFAGTNEKLLKMYTGENIGMVILNKETMFADSRGVGRTFYITVPTDADYFISVITNSAVGRDLDVTVDRQGIIEGKVIGDNGWRASFMIDPVSRVGTSKTIHLSKGDHTISFIGKGPEVPIIERIRIAKNEIDAQLSVADLIAWNRKFALKTMPANYFEMKKNGAINPSALAMTASSEDPLYTYQGKLDASFTYSYCLNVFLTAGQFKTYQTKNSTTDPVMYIFLMDNPQQYSWSNDDGGGGYESKISFTVPVSEVYTLVLRSYATGNSGVGELLADGQPFQSSVVIGGAMVAASYYTSPGGELNFFTAKPGRNTQGITYDTKLFLMPGYTSPINGYNDDYYGSGTFPWGRLSRIKKILSQEVRYCLITHCFSGYSATCDVYAKCSNTSEFPDSSFPNYKADDVIKSSDASSLYNCISWSGGLVSHTKNVWVNPFNTRNEFDMYYYNTHPDYSPRYVGAENFTRVGATPENVVVNLWAKGSPPYTDSFTHGSARKPANSHLHGYDWESKCGPSVRVFHPEDALSGPCYGSIVYKYRSEGTYAQSPKMTALGIKRPLSTLDESVKLGLSKINEILFTSDELHKLKKHIEKIPNDVTSEFSKKFEMWRSTWSSSPLKYKSHTRDFAKSDEYEAFSDFCVKHGKLIWPLLFYNFQCGNLFLINIFEDLLYPDRKNVLERIKAKNESNRYASDGTFIIYTLDGNWREFCKEVLKHELE